MRRWRIAVLTGLLLAGCGRPATPTLPAGYAPDPVPAATQDYVAPVPYTGIPRVTGRTAQENLEFRVESVLLPQIRRQVRVPVTCAGSVVPDGTTRTVRCTAVWANVAVPFDVRVEGSGRPFYRLTVRQRKALLLRDAVRDAWAAENRNSPAALSCERSIPAAVLVEPDVPTPYRCAADASTYRVRIQVEELGSRILFESGG